MENKFLFLIRLLFGYNCFFINMHYVVIWVACSLNVVEIYIVDTNRFFSIC